MHTFASFYDSDEVRSLPREDLDQMLLQMDADEQAFRERFLTFTNAASSYFTCNINFINDCNSLELAIIHDEEILKLYVALHEKIQVAAEFMHPLDIVFEHQACVALYSGDGKWYRASILEYCSFTQHVKVKYVDHGYIGIVRLADVKKIYEEFTILPASTIPATLHGVKLNPDIDIETATNEFKNTFLGKEPFHAKVTDINNGSISVKLKNKFGNLVYDHLIKNNFFLCSDVN